jgi:hypothetical protein
MRYALFAFTISFGLLGCVSNPPAPNPSVVENEIIRSSVTELCAAILNVQGAAQAGYLGVQREHFTANDGWIAEVETSLRTDLEAVISPSATLMGPILPASLVGKGGSAGTYNAAVGGSMDQTATIIRDNKHYLVVESLLQDQELCFPKDTPLYHVYHDDIAEYQNEGKYLTGRLGIRAWLFNGVRAQNFNSLINPQTQVVQGPSQPEAQRVPREIRFGTSQPKVLKTIPPPPFTQGATYKKLSIAVFADPNLPPKPLSYSVKTVTTKGSDPLPQGVCDPSSLNTDNFTINNDPPSWIKINAITGELTVGPVPGSSSGGSGQPGNSAFDGIIVTATNGIKSNSVCFSVTIVPAPKATTWGPTYSATFQFIIKANGQIGPSFTTNNAKGGVASLFSTTRTETNFINIALTATGVPLITQEPPAGRLAIAGQHGIATSDNVDAINAAVRRLDDALLRLNLSNVLNQP